MHTLILTLTLAGNYEAGTAIVVGLVGAIAMLMVFFFLVALPFRLANARRNAGTT